MFLGFGGILPFLGVIPAMIAERKGRKGFVWWIYGTTMFIFALPHALMLDELVDPDADPEFRPCPFCAKTIRFEAKRCRYCTRDVPPPERFDEYSPTQFLIDKLSSPDPRDRAKAIIILGDRGPSEREAVATLATLLDSPSRHVRIRVEWALERITGRTRPPAQQPRQQLLLNAEDAGAQRRSRTGADSALNEPD
jgi:hypothetical protein